MPCLQEVGTPEPQRDGVTIRAIENEKIVPGEYDGDDARVERGGREIKTSAVRPSSEHGRANSANIFEAD